MKNLKDMEKNENYFVREDIVSEQHVHHKDEYREKKRDKVIFMSTILEETTPQPKRKEDYEKSLNEFYKLTEITDYLKDDGSMALYSYSYTNLNKEKPKKAQEFYNKLKKSGYELYLLDDETLNEIKDGFDLIYKINN